MGENQLKYMCGSVWVCVFFILSVWCELSPISCPDTQGVYFLTAAPLSGILETTERAGLFRLAHETSFRTLESHAPACPRALHTTTHAHDLSGVSHALR
ncbi:U-box domain-containing protein 45 [Clarias magur]|uniref:U-box domain-containing protein 45 n=1 Tax=Clarias magur TaxID=1594786 RepID=A0A8J4WWY0_CLAMG|nr:U-box domain-containing protein 45 [Clarias magur]